MRIKALVTICAGSDVHPPGALFTINEEEGQDLVLRGFAEALETSLEEEGRAPEPRKKK